MSDELMNTKEVARFLGIHEKQVYLLVKSRRIPSTRITGKWIFPRKLVEDWIAGNARKGLVRPRPLGGREGVILASGSNDPVLDLFQTYFRRSCPELSIFSANTGSSEGLKALDRGATDIAWSHLFDPRTGSYNVPFLSTFLPHLQPVVVNLFHRELGLVAAAKNRLAVRGFEDLARQEVRFINRQKGSGTRLFLDYHLKRLRLPPSAIRGYEREVCTHLEVGLAILAGEADAGLATATTARLLGLSFTPITRESFDMIMDRETFFERGSQAFLEILQSRDFRTQVTKWGGHDFSHSGKIVYAHQ